MVMATQNPIEQEGTYQLPEAQVDRFMLKVVLDYPTLEEEKLIVKENIQGGLPQVKPVTTAEDVYKRQLQAIRPHSLGSLSLYTASVLPILVRQFRPSFLF